jgi:hypothetical protein
VLVVGRDEDDERRLRESAEHAGEVQSAEPGHLDVAEHDVDGLGVEREQGLGRAAGGADPADPGVAAEQPEQLLAGRRLVVDDERAQRRRTRRPRPGHRRAGHDGRVRRCRAR